MPEYLAPGVYIEETSFRSKSIEGVSTTTTGFIGPTRYGPIDLEPDIITSLGEFERIYGDGQPLVFSDAGTLPNYMWHAARAFFEEGGKRLYIARTYLANSDTDSGRASALLRTPDAGDIQTGLRFTARFPGVLGNLRVRLTLRWGPSILGGAGGTTTLGALAPGDIVWLSPGTKVLSTANPPVASRVAAGSELFVARRPATGEDRWEFVGANGTAMVLDNNQETSREARVVTLSVTVWSPQAGGQSTVWDGLSLASDHIGPSGLRDGITALFEADPSNAALARTLPIVVALAGTKTTGMDVATLLRGKTPSSGALGATMSVDDFIAAVRADPPHDALDATRLKTALEAAFPVAEDRRFRTADVNRARTLPVPPAAGGGGPSVEQQFVDSFKPGGLSRPDFSASSNTIDLTLAGGKDGKRPGVAEYEGTADDDSTIKTGLKAFEDLEDISIVAAPGYSHTFDDTAQAVQGLLLSHADAMRYRIAVLDAGRGFSIAEVRQQRGKIDSTYGAIYYPWVRVMDPITREPIHLPPSGFVAGIYARNDIERAVYKAPANEVVNLAIGFEQLLNKAQQDVLNPEGINCFRYFEGRGFRLWGARTVSSDPEWKYVNLRRYFAYLERSVDRGTQWVVFEPNGERLWANVRRTIEDFLFNEWQNGALLGDKPERAYFVKCDRSTMTQNDLDNGRLVCLVGVAALRPAEFVIFRIGQWTGDRRG
jgi:phage tail sheath protein FI